MYTSMFRKAMLGDTATLNLDFTTGVLDSRLTFTRASTATYINSSGYVTTMGAAPTNDPTKARFDYDPVTLAPRGLLIENQSINYLPYSVALSGTGWSSGGVVIKTTGYATGPDGLSNSATRFQMNYSASTGTGRVYYDASASYSTKPYTTSVWVKSNTGSNQTLNIWNTNGVGTTITATPSWQRFKTINTTGTSLPGFFYLENPSTDPALVADVLVYGAQLEAGSGASSYIPTTTSQATRNGDSCVMSDISSLSYSNTNGSMVYCGRFSKINSASYPTRMGFTTSGGADTAFEIFTNATTIYSGIRSTAANNEITRTIAIDTDYKLATAFNVSAASQVRCSLNGAAAVGSSTSALTATRTPTVFGFTRSGYELYFPCGTINAAKYYNTTLTDAELVSQST